MAVELDAEGVDARVVKALGHPTRVRILNVLRDRELASPVELSAELGLALGTVGYHVRRLETLGFIELAKRTQRRGAVEHHYRARAALDSPVEPPSGQRIDHTSRAAAAVAVAQEAQEALPRGGFDAAVTRADRRVITLDARARRQLERELPRWQATVERVARGSAARLAAAAQPTPRECIAVVMHFEVVAELGDDDR